MTTLGNTDSKPAEGSNREPGYSWTWNWGFPKNNKIEPEPLQGKGNTLGVSSQNEGWGSEGESDRKHLGRVDSSRWHNMHWISGHSIRIVTWSNQIEDSQGGTCILTCVVWSFLWGNHLQDPVTCWPLSTSGTLWFLWLQVGTRLLS